MDERTNAEKAATYFRRDVAKHVMTVVRAEGVHRHLHFGEPGTGTHHFHLITWPGSLCISGDCGTYVFERLQDMFAFFRRDEDGINPGYWAEKLQAADYGRRSGCDGVEEFSWSQFVRDVREHIDCALGEEPDSNGLRDEVESQLIDLDQDEWAAVNFIRDFRHGTFFFEDWERTSRVYTTRYLWNLHAIVWGIAQFDARPGPARGQRHQHQGSGMSARALPPAAMNRAAAAAYVGLSEATFARLVQKKQAPQPRQLAGKRVGWLRCELDAWLLSRPVSDQLPPPNCGAKKPRAKKVAANDPTMRPAARVDLKAA